MSFSDVAHSCVFLSRFPVALLVDILDGRRHGENASVRLVFRMGLEKGVNFFSAHLDSRSQPRKTAVFVPSS